MTHFAASPPVARLLFAPISVFLLLLLISSLLPLHSVCPVVCVWCLLIIILWGCHLPQIVFHFMVHICCITPVYITICFWVCYEKACVKFVLKSYFYLLWKKIVVYLHCNTNNAYYTLYKYIDLLGRLLILSILKIIIIMKNIENWMQIDI